MDGEAFSLAASSPASLAAAVGAGEASFRAAVVVAVVVRVTRAAAVAGAAHQCLSATAGKARAGIFRSKCAATSRYAGHQGPPCTRKPVMTAPCPTGPFLTLSTRHLSCTLLLPVSQAFSRDVKINSEIDFFWQVQQQSLSHGGMQRKPSEKEHQQKETELFASNQGNVGINFAKYDAIQVQRSGNDIQEVPEMNAFNQLDTFVPDFLKRNIGLCRYDRPTPVQRHAIPFGLDGRDLMCCAETGSGKTAAFLLPVIASLEARLEPLQGPAVPSALVMAPTRELVSQIYNEACKFCVRSDLRVVQVYGGAEVRQQLAQLALGCDIMLATPGRLIDFMDRGLVSMSQCQYLVLDEADRMLGMS